MAKWICNTKCYVSVDGACKLYYPGDKVDGNIGAGGKKHFDLEPGSATSESDEPTNKELQASINELGGSFPPQANKATLKEILAGLKGD